MVGTPPELERGTGVPAHVQIERWLLGSIDRGELAPGDRLPGERELAGRLGVSRMTLRQALARLELDGVLVRVPGRSGGAFVAEPRVDCDLTGQAGFTEQMRRAHPRARARVLEARTVPAPASVAAALRLAAGEPVHEVARVRSAGRSPVALERSFFPALPGFLDEDLSGSLHALLGERYGLAPRTALEHLDPVVATAAEAAELGMSRAHRSCGSSAPPTPPTAPRSSTPATCSAPIGCGSRYGPGSANPPPPPDRKAGP